MPAGSASMRSSTGDHSALNSRADRGRRRRALRAGPIPIEQQVDFDFERGAIEARQRVRRAVRQRQQRARKRLCGAARSARRLRHATAALDRGPRATRSAKRQIAEVLESAAARRRDHARADPVRRALRAASRRAPPRTGAHLPPDARCGCRACRRGSAGRRVGVGASIRTAVALRADQPRIGPRRGIAVEETHDARRATLVARRQKRQIVEARCARADRLLHGAVMTHVRAGPDRRCGSSDADRSCARQRSSPRARPFDQGHGARPRVFKADVGQIVGAREPIEIIVRDREARRLVELLDAERRARHFRIDDRQGRPE